MSGSWIRSVSTVGNQHRTPFCRRFIAVARINEGANDHDTGHLAVRAGRGLQRNAGQAGDLGEVLLQLVNHL